jgi:molecular chaperone DnaJ
MEPVKDHYRLLNISPRATTEEIKKAFRKLALKYHPDKNDSPSAAKTFVAIQEAYHILSDRKKRAAYNYKRYTQSPHRAARTVIQAAEDVLFLSDKLKKEILAKDPYRIDRDLLFFQLSDLLSDEAMFVIKESGSPEIIQRIVNNILNCTKFLSYEFSKEIIQKLDPLRVVAPGIKQELTDTLRQNRQQYYWNRYKIFIAVAVAVLFCFFLFFAGRR